MAAGSFAGQAASSIIVAFFLPCMLVLVQRRAETIVVALCFAFGWLMGISVAGVVFVSGLSGDRAVLASVGAVSSELGRFLVYRGYRAVEKLELAAELRLDDASSSLAGGFGTAALHAVFLFAAVPAPTVSHAVVILMFVLLDLALAGLLFCEARDAPANHPGTGSCLVLAERFFFDSRHTTTFKFAAAVALHVAATFASSLDNRAIAVPAVAVAAAVAAALAFRGRTRVFPLVSARGGRILRDVGPHT